MTIDAYTPTAAQLALQKLIRDYTHILAYGGARSGKTFEFCRAQILIAARYGGRHAVFRQHFNAVKNSVFNDTYPKVINLCFPGLTYERNASDTYYRLFNGAEIWFIGLDDKQRVDKILGREFATVYFNECSEISYHAVETALTRLSGVCTDETGRALKNRAFYDCNPPARSHWAHKVFIERIRPGTRITIPRKETYACIRINPADNTANLPQDYLERLRELSPEKQRRFLFGEWSDDTENALWKRKMIDPFRAEDVPEGMERIVVGVDPAITTNETSDRTGIIVAGIVPEADGREHFYVLEDQSGIYTPKEWTTIVNHLFGKWNANQVVVEVNQGGQLVTEALRNANYALPIQAVRASHGKRVRAEPVAVLYEQGLVHHVGELPDLEEELTSYTGAIGEKSPDRMDALVWAITALTDTAKVSGGDVWFG